MRKLLFEQLFSFGCLGVAVLTLTGCSTVGSSASDLGLAGASGIAGYHLSEHRETGAVVGAVAGYTASRVAHSRVSTAISAAEQKGYDRGLNQAVKRHYWSIQNRQQSQDDGTSTDVKLLAITVPETTSNGVIQNAHVEYLRVR